MSEIIQVSKGQARRFMLRHQGLLPPRKLRGKAGILDFFGRVGNIQFDSINVVGGNPDLVLQARVANYRPKLLNELLYKERELIDGWDKQASIFRVGDWPHFARRRKAMQAYYGPELVAGGKLSVADKVKEAIGERGPLSSIDIKDDSRIDWHWGVPTSMTRAAMEALYAIGELGIDHRVHTRRSFDLMEKLIGAKLMRAEEPHPKDEDYLDWHLMRRVGSMGLAHPKAGEAWSGMYSGTEGVSAKERNVGLKRLVEAGKLAQVEVEGLAGQVFYVRGDDLDGLEAAKRRSRAKKRAAFIAPLDNLMWQRHVIGMVFDFEYTWEVYVPAAKRKYGYYVLPVLYGDRLVGRVDPKFHRDSGVLEIKGWWWEEGVDPKDEEMLAAVAECLEAFGRYLGVGAVSSN